VICFYLETLAVKRLKQFAEVVLFSFAKKYNFDNKTSQLKIDQFSTIKMSAFIFIHSLSVDFMYRSVIVLLTETKEVLTIFLNSI
jgi:hypothetical protein